jgi:hypothetical protein
MGIQSVEEAHDIIDMNPDGSIASITTESLRGSVREVRPVVEVVQAEQPSVVAQQATAAPAAQETGPTIDQETGEDFDAGTDEFVNQMNDEPVAEPSKQTTRRRTSTAAME